MSLTHTEHQQAIAEWHKLEICRILIWKEEEYTQFQHDMGLSYLEWYCKGTDQYRMALECSRLFWAWWRSCWLNRDMAFVDSCGIENVSLKFRRELYEELNRGSYLVNDIRPGKVIIDDCKQLIYN